MAADPTIIELTDKQKIEILRGARDILGENGENWAKCVWFGDRNCWGGDDPSEEWFPGAESDYCGVVDREEANIWCLMGALEESAYRLGIVKMVELSERLANPISLERLVQTNKQWEKWSVIDVNDSAETEWEDIAWLLDTRLSELEGGA